jgi:hypothetical protein
VSVQNDPPPTGSFPAPFDTPPDVAAGGLLARLDALTAHHRAACPAYARIIAAQGYGGQGYTDSPAAGLAALPYLPVGLFKRLDLISVPPESIVTWLSSSGTSGVPSRVGLDRDTARRQSRTLAAIMRPLLGPQRRPFVVIDGQAVRERGDGLSARATAVAGFALFGREPLFLLDEGGRPDWHALLAYRQRHAGEALLLFGFTAMVWTVLVEAARRDGVTLDLSPALLLHGGGWKRLAGRAVGPATLRAGLARTMNLHDVRNYYGLVEQVGTVFPECAAGRLHAPAQAGVMVRDPVTLAPLPVGEAGLLQLFSDVPLSYPGHSLLTEDMGTVIGLDGCPCGWRGTHFAVHGRLPRAEIRGCSDVRRGP